MFERRCFNEEENYAAAGKVISRWNWREKVQVDGSTLFVEVGNSYLTGSKRRRNERKYAAVRCGGQVRRCVANVSSLVEHRHFRVPVQLPESFQPVLQTILARGAGRRPHHGLLRHENCIGDALRTRPAGLLR